jgi:hypothetical protein
VHTEHAAGRHRRRAIESSVAGLVEVRDREVKAAGGKRRRSWKAGGALTTKRLRLRRSQTRDLGLKPGGADSAETGQGFHPYLRMAPGSHGVCDEKASEWGSR